MGPTAYIDAGYNPRNPAGGPGPDVGLGDDYLRRDSEEVEKLLFPEYGPDRSRHDSAPESDDSDAPSLSSPALPQAGFDVAVKVESGDDQDAYEASTKLAKVEVEKRGQQNRASPLQRK